MKSIKIIIMVFFIALLSCSFTLWKPAALKAKEAAAEKAHTEELYERAMKKQLTKAEEEILCERIIKEDRTINGLDVIDIDGCLAQIETRRIEKAETEKATTIERLKDSACYDLALIKKQQGYMRHQREVAKMSGFIDKRIMHRAAEGIIQDRKDLKETKRRYKQLTGKSMNLNDCPN